MEISVEKQMEYLTSKGCFIDKINININKNDTEILVAYNPNKELVVPIKNINGEYSFYQHISESFWEVFNSDIRCNIPYSC
jgi:hypothetical protein